MTGLFLALLLSAPGVTYQSPSGFQLTLPPGFQQSVDFPTGPTSAVPAPPGSHPTIEAVFADDNDAGVSSLAIALAQTPLDVGTGSPERVADLAIGYARDVLGAELRLEWVERVTTVGPAGVEGLELAGRLTLSEGTHDEDRVAQLAFLPFGKRQVIVFVSMPASRFAVLSEQVESTVQGITFSGVIAPQQSSSFVRAGIGAAIGLVVALARLRWRRMRKREVREP